MKKCPLLILIISTALLITVPGLLLKTGVLQGSDTSGEEEVNIRELFSGQPGAASTIHEVKLLAENYVSKDSDGRDVKAEMLELARAKQEQAGAEQETELVPKPSKAERAEEPSESEEEKEEEEDTESEEEETGSDEEEEEEESEEEDEAETAQSTPENPIFTVVGDDYFKDACFIGDSRVQGFGLYSGLETTVYSKTGFQIYRVFKDRIVDSPVGKLTVPEALASGVQFKKIYLKFGLNELGMADEQFGSEYYDLLDVVKALQPDATIYVQEVIHVTKGKAADSTIFNNERINARNEVIREVARNEHVYFLELNEVFTDEEGNLPSEYTSDGIHLSAKYIELWKNYLEAHAVEVD